MRPEGPYTDGLQDLVNDLPPGIDMVEVGCFYGESSLIFLNSGKINRFYAVDAWLNGLDTNDKDTVKIDLTVVEIIFDAKTQPFRDRIRKLRMDSLEAYKLFDDNSMDLIYLDSCHSYDHAKAELPLYWSKVKKGGALAGHDYGNTIYPWLTHAINEFLGKPDKIYQDGSWIKIKHGDSPREGESIK